MKVNVVIIVTEKDLALETSHVSYRGEGLRPYFTNTSYYPQQLSHGPNPSRFSVFSRGFTSEKECASCLSLWQSH